MNIHSTGTILIVDDTPMQVQMVHAAIASHFGLSILTAGSGEEAMALLAEHEGEVDIVVTDVIMPGISGMELMDKVHVLQPDTPIILMTAYSNVDILIAAIKKKAFDLILKPIDQSILVQTIEKALKHKQLLDLEKNYLVTLQKSIEEKTNALQAKMFELEQSRAAQVAEHDELKKVFAKVTQIKQEWERTMDCISDMVLLVDNSGKIGRCNRSFRDFCGMSYQLLLGRNWQELFVLPPDMPFPSGSELFHTSSARWFIFSFYPFIDTVTNSPRGTVITVIDTTERKQTMAALEQAYQDLKTTQAHILQTEKMASIGQLAAGVAHEINNPIGFVTSNINTLGKYQQRMISYMTEQDRFLAQVLSPEQRGNLDVLRAEMKIDHVLNDSEKLIGETLDGTERVRRIVMDLKTFSRTDEGDYQRADLIACIESAINIVWNELKYKITLERDFGSIPLVKCYPQKLNQVFVNLLVNASHAIKETGRVTISAHVLNDTVALTFTDTGCGIPKEHLSHIFEPFFTTKEVGQGTGLGLSISYDIIKKHNGEISVTSEVGKGTSFLITLPLIV